MKINFLSIFSFKHIISLCGLKYRILEFRQKYRSFQKYDLYQPVFYISFPYFTFVHHNVFKMHIKIYPRTLGKYPHPDQSHHFSISIRSFGISLNSAGKIGAYQKATLKAPRDAICGKGVQAKSFGELGVEIPITDIRIPGSVKRSAVACLREFYT